MKAMRSLSPGAILLSLVLLCAPAKAFDITSLTAEQILQIGSIAESLGISPTALLFAAADGITVDDIAILPAETQTQVLSYLASGGTLPTDFTSLQDFSALLSTADALGVDAGALALALAALDGFDSADIAILPPAVQSALLAYLSTGGILPNDLAGLTALLATLSDASEMYYSNAESKWISNTYAAADIDADGFLDAIEAAAGSSPADAASTPLGGSVQALTLTVKALQIKLNFKKSDGGDVLTLKGFVGSTGAESREGKPAVIYIGGIARAFTLDEKGRSPKSAAPDQFSIGKPRNGASKVSAKLRSADFAAPLSGEKLSDESIKSTSTVRVIVAVDQGIHSSDVNVNYAAKQGKSGRAKKSK